MINKGILESRTGGTTINYPSTGLLAYYKLDELSGSVINTVGTGNGTNFGATTGVSGKKGLAYSFDGINDYVNTNLNLLGGKSAFTVAFWFKNLDIVNPNILFGQYTTGSQKMYISVSSGYLRAFTYTTVAKGGNVFIFSDMSNFHLFTITYNGVQMICTLDNVESTTIYPQTGAINNTSPLTERIGDDGRGLYYGKAIIDEVAIWDRAISTDEKTLLWNSGEGITYTL